VKPSGRFGAPEAEARLSGAGDSGEFIVLSVLAVMTVSLLR
jgi:hypothetical protein